MVIRHNYKDFFVYIRISELPENQRDEFSRFMANQTMPLVFDEINKKYLDDAVFEWD